MLVLTSLILTGYHDGYMTANKQKIVLFPTEFERNDRMKSVFQAREFLRDSIRFASITNAFFGYEMLLFVHRAF